MYKINTCKKIKNNQFAQTNVTKTFFDLYKLVLAKINPLEFSFDFL